MRKKRMTQLSCMAPRVVAEPRSLVKGRDNPQVLPLSATTSENLASSDGGVALPCGASSV